MAKPAMTTRPKGHLVFAVFMRGGTEIRIRVKAPEGLTVDTRRGRWKYGGQTFPIGAHTLQFREDDGPALVFNNRWSPDLERLGELFADWRTKQIQEGEYHIA